ncbi:MAG TPA: DNA gyrase subunit A [Thermoanaerobaculia bacterium]|jgi:DNA gyrase subunit A|nr:DNA gyrase subunit A [Thermoanaerobaculia bacterium]
MTDNDQNLPFEQPIPVDIEVEMRRSYLDYAMSVIVGRALPDVRDGLKPVHRRVLYGMWESGNRSDRAYKKSARIVGDVMGKYHPHGDSAIYDTVVRMAQDFALRYLLVDGQGNFGSLDGDNPAAMRYTEVRLTKLAEEMIREDIDKETVDWGPNYDGSETEPLVLPARVPNLLVNGSSGIAVGMATNIPPHNLGEVVDGLLMMIENPDVTISELMQAIPGPDFPTAGTIHGLAGIRSAYTTGRGIMQIRAKAEIETHAKTERQSIIVTEIPYQVNKKRLIERMAELVREKKLEGISDLRDESDRDGIRIVLDLKKGEQPEIILNALYKLTQMQVTFGIIFLAIVDNQPKVMTLKELLFHFLNHRKTVIIRRTRYDLRKAEERAHILEGILKALDHLDEVIQTIRASQTPGEAKDNLIARFAFTDVQAQAILDMRLQRLTGLERDKVVEEYRELMILIEKLRAILGSDRLVLEEIKRELGELKEAYGDKRRTDIIPETADISIEDLIADEPMVITVSRTGYVKRSPLTLYRSQNRGGRGRTGMGTKEDDFVEHLYVATAHSYILVFTESGRVHWLKVHEIPEAGPTARGKAIVNLLELEPTERLATTVAVRTFPDDRYLVFATEKGTVKKTELSLYANPRVGGIIGINIDEGDRLLAVRETDGKKDILFATAKGFAIRFPESDARSMGRATYGVRGITLREGDRVVGMEALDRNGEILSVTERGFGKRTPVDEYRLQSRGGLGIINLKVGPKTGEVIGARHVTASDGLMLITQEGMIIRINVSGVRVVGRSTMGVKLMNLSTDDRLVSIAKVEREEEAMVEGEGGGSPALLEAGEIEPELELEAADDMDDLDGGLGDLADLDEDEDDGGEGGPDETVH